MAKPLWARCMRCGRKFESYSISSLDHLVDMHKVYTTDGKQCMCDKQMALTFRWNEQRKAWEEK